MEKNDDANDFAQLHKATNAWRSVRGRVWDIQARVC